MPSKPAPAACSTSLFARRTTAFSSAPGSDVKLVDRKMPDLAQRNRPAGGTGRGAGRGRRSCRCRRNPGGQDLWSWSIVPVVVAATAGSRLLRAPSRQTPASPPGSARTGCSPASRSRRSPLPASPCPDREAVSRSAPPRRPGPAHHQRFLRIIGEHLPDFRHGADGRRDFLKFLNRGRVGHVKNTFTTLSS